MKPQLVKIVKNAICYSIDIISVLLFNAIYLNIILDFAQHLYYLFIFMNNLELRMVLCFTTYVKISTSKFD